MRLEQLSNNELWDKWKVAIEDLAGRPGNYYLKRQVDLLEDEVIRRMKEASRRPLGVQA